MALKTEGIIFLAIAWGFIFTLAGYCYYKVLTIKKGKKSRV